MCDNCRSRAKEFQVHYATGWYGPAKGETFEFDDGWKPKLVLKKRLEIEVEVGRTQQNVRR